MFILSSHKSSLIQYAIFHNATILIILLRQSKKYVYPKIVSLARIFSLQNILLLQNIY